MTLIAFVLTKTLGFSALMKTFPKVHLRCLIHQDVLGNEIGKQLKPWEGFDFSSKAWEGISGEAGAAKLDSDLESKKNIRKIRIKKWQWFLLAVNFQISR